MIDLHSPQGALTVKLPGDLIAELNRIAKERAMTIDEMVAEACLMYVEPHMWEQCYQAWVHHQPDAPESALLLNKPQ
jgi:hypothetical protein